MNNLDQNDAAKQWVSNEITDDFLKKYIPIEAFVALKNIPQETVLQMIREGTCVGYTKNNQWFVGRNELGDFTGSISIGQPKPVGGNAPGKASNNFLSKLIRGDFGLPVTFWIFGVCLGIALMPVLIAIVTLNEDFFVWVFSIWVGYEILVAIGVLRAANRHTGSKGLAVCAQILTVFLIGIILLIWLYLLMIFNSGYAGN